MMRRIGLFLALLAGLALAACDGSPANPLVGTWRMVPEKGNALSEGIGFLMRDQTLVFTDDSMVTGGDATKVRYEVADDRVLVFPADGGGRGIVYILLDRNRIANELPLGQRIVFERVER